MTNNPANTEQPSPVEIVAGDRLNGEAGDSGSDHAPPVEITGERVGDSDRSGLIALFSIGVALSIVVHAAFLGASLLHLPLTAPANEEALPVTVVPDPAQPETQAKPASPQTPPAPETPALKEQPKPAPQTLAPKEELKPPAPQSAPQKEEPKPSAPQTQQQEKAEASQPPPRGQTPAPDTPPPTSSAPTSSAPLPPPPSANAGPGEGVVADKLAQSAVAELRAAIKRCWTIPPGWTNPHQVTVVMEVRLDRNGALASHPVLLEFSASELGMTAAKNALAAVARCAPYKLPPEKFSQWRETQVRLTPE